MRRVLLLTTLFFPPIFITGYLKWYTLVAILTAPLLALVLHGISIATYPNKVGIILATFTGSIFIFTDLVQMVAYKLTGSELGFAFWYQTNWDAILYATWLQRLEFVVVITWLFTAIFLLYRILGTVIEKPTRRSRAIWITAVPIFIAIIPWIPHSSIRPAVALASTFSHEKALVTLDPVAAKASGIKLSDINTQTLEVKGAGKNLVLIYLESFENTFLDESLFPNLAPNIQSLRREAVTFDEIIPGLNAGFTFGGIYSSLFGTHLIQAQIRGSEMRSTGLNVQVGRDLLSIPKILHLSGYEQTFVVGHASEFSGLNVLLNREGYDKIQTSVPNDGTHGIWRKTGDYWGWYDRELFEHAYDEFEQLSRKNKPFHLTILTIDTHTPDGRIEEKRREEKRREEKRREEKRRGLSLEWRWQATPHSSTSNRPSSGRVYS